MVAMRTWKEDAIERGEREFEGKKMFVKTRVIVRTVAFEKSSACMFQVKGENYAECDRILETFLDPRCTCWVPMPKDKCPVEHDPIAQTEMPTDCEDVPADHVLAP